MHGAFHPSDLEVRVRLVSDSGWTRLIYTLHSPTGVVPFSHREIMGPDFKGSPEDFHRNLLTQVETLGDGVDMDGTLVLRPDVERKLDGLGRWLWQQLFNHEMQQAYRQFRDLVRTLLIISDEPWIPWEMIRPYDDRGEILDDEFFVERFELTRWLAGDRPAPGEIMVRVLACVGQRVGLPLAEAEQELVTGLSRSQEIRDASPATPGAATLMARLQEGGIGLLHFIGHGTFDPALPNEAGFPLTDGSVFRPSDLHGPVQTQLSRDRPLVFLNACRSGRQGWSWTSLGGWADRWIRGCGCGAFLGPQWEVRDSAAFAFAQSFYGSLGRGETLGMAAKAARKEARKTAPGDPSWLAYAVYGHPNARILFGKHSEPIAETPHTSGISSEIDNVSLQLGRAAEAPPPSSRDLRIKGQSGVKRQRGDQVFEKLAQALPQLRSQFGLIGLIVTVGGFIATRQVAPDSLPAQIAAAAGGVNIVVFGQVFYFLNLIPPRERARFIVVLFVIFCVSTFLLLGTAIGLASQQRLRLSDVSLTGWHRGGEVAATTLDDLAVTWAHDGQDEDLQLTVVNPQNGARVGPFSVKASDHQLRIPQGDLQPLWPLPRLGKVYSVRIQLQSRSRSLSFGPLDVAAGLLVMYFFDEGTLTVASMRTPNQIVEHDFNARCIAWPRSGQQPDPASVSIDVSQGKGKVKFPVGFIPDLDSLKCVYLGSYAQQLVRYKNLTP